MKIKPDNRRRIVLALAFALLSAGAVFYAAESLSSAPSTGLDYFKGSWTVALKSNPKESFRWTVREDLRGGWMAGVVEKNGEKVSTDFWRQAGQKIERFAFTADGTFVRLDSQGWESGRLIFNGVASDRTGETRIRETITKINERRFHALWERESTDGKWIAFADEICSRQ